MNGSSIDIPDREKARVHWIYLVPILGVHCLASRLCLHFLVGRVSYLRS